MRRVTVKETTTVSAKLLDGLLRRDATSRDDRLSASHTGHVQEPGEILDRATSDEQESRYGGNQHEDAQRAAGEIHPEVADGVLTVANESANQRNSNRDAGSGGDEILHAQASELDEVPEGRLR